MIDIIISNHTYYIFAKKINLKFLSIILLSFYSLSLFSQSRNADVDFEKEVEEVIFTATKYPKALDKLPMPTTVISAKEIQESGANDAGWGHYDHVSHMLTPIAGGILVFKTYDGHFAKMEILSFYNNMDPSTNPYGGYFTFNYVYQPNENNTSF